MVVTADDIAAGLAACEDETATDVERGAALEHLVAALLADVPGIDFTTQNNKDAFATQEIDVAVWNEGHPAGLAGFPKVFLVECKNWAAPVGSVELAWFDTKLRLKGCAFGVLIALNGITGKHHSLTAAHSILAAAMREERDIVVITKADLEALGTSADLVPLIKRKVMLNRVSKPL